MPLKKRERLSAEDRRLALTQYTPCWFRYPELRDCIDMHTRIAQAWMMLEEAE